MAEFKGDTVLAVDGGGTSCRIAVSDGHRAESIETGPANVSTDFEAAIAELNEGFARLGKRTGIDLARLPAYLGLAGVVSEEIAARVADALPVVQVKIEDDRPAALRGALGPSDGVVAHCGTGSFLAARIGGQIKLIGGWGHVLGDEGSAQWVGKRALALTLQAVDRRRPVTALAEALLERFAGSAGIVRFAAKASPNAFGELAPLVTSHAASGDTLAIAVLQMAAGEIASALADIGWTPGTKVCLTGGLGPHLALWLSPVIRADLAPPHGTPLDGAIALAFDLSADLAHASR